MREHIATTMPMPTLQRLSPAEKARQRREEDERPALITEVVSTDDAHLSSAVSNSKTRTLSRIVMPPEALFVKVGTRLPPELVDWLKHQVTEYRRRNPHAPRLTIEELLRIAIVDLQARGPVDKTVARYRATVSSS